MCLISQDLKPKYNELLHMNHLWMESSPNLFPSLIPKESPIPRPNPDSICFKALNCHFTCMLIGWRPHPNWKNSSGRCSRPWWGMPSKDEDVCLQYWAVWDLRIEDCGQGVEAAVLWGELGVQECDLLLLEISNDGGVGLLNCLSKQFITKMLLSLCVYLHDSS